MAGEEFFTLCQADGVAELTLQRAPVNALNRAFRQSLIHHFDRLSEDPEVRVVILRSGLKTFTAGVDLREPPEPEGPGSRRDAQRLNRELFAAIRDCGLPVIGVLDGVAAGAGLALLASCDLVICSERASVRLTEIDHGRMADIATLRRLLPRAVAARLALLAQPMSAADLLHYGIASALAPSDTIDAEARTWAAQIATRPSAAVRLTKMALNTTEAMPLREGSRFVQQLSDQLKKAD